MFERFGEFDSCEELNRAAAGQKAEGDLEALKALAKENGLDPEDAEDYMDGIIPELATPMDAAMGRIDVWREASKKDINIRIALDVLRTMVWDKEMQEAVMRKGRSPQKFMEILKAHAKKYQVNGCGSACATDRDKEAALRAYFEDGEDALKQELEDQRRRFLE